LLQTVLLDCKSEYFLQLQDKNKLFLYKYVNRKLPKHAS